MIHPPHLSSEITQVCVISSFFLIPAPPSLSHRAKTKGTGWKWQQRDRTHDQKISRHRVNEADQEERSTA